MSTVNKTTQPVKTTVKPTITPTRPVRSEQANTMGGESSRVNYFLFTRENYIWMIGGICLIFLGFFLMSGGKSANPHEFHYDEIYSFQRITLAPILVLLGFAVEIFAIMKMPKADTTQPKMAE